MTRTRKILLSLVTPGGAPPSEFRIFTAGQVETTKGTFTFDDEAAKSVMADYAQHGIDLMIDYDHASLSSLPVDPALAGKAAGWFNLELRGGELWAVNVRWTPAAAQALTAKEWRFMSPAFSTTEDGRVTSLMNVAITNLPATRNLTPLMAASITKLGATMDPDQVKQALEALKSGDDAKCAEILTAMIAAAASGGAVPAESSAEPAAPAEMSEEPKDPPADAKDDDKKDKPAEVAASIARLMRMSGKTSFVATVEDVAVWRASHIERETDRAAVAKERAILESAERRKGCVDLVTQAHRAPATVWADDKGETPKAYLLSMSIADFRAYVADQIKACGGRPAPKPPTKTAAIPGASTEGLTPAQLQICKDTGCDPAVFASLSAHRDSVVKGT